MAVTFAHQVNAVPPDLLTRVVGEFNEMPCLRLTLPQAMRLCARQCSTPSSRLTSSSAIVGGSSQRNTRTIERTRRRRHARDRWRRA
jgi:hypothetical protein